MTGSPMPRATEQASVAVSSARIFMPSSLPSGTRASVAGAADARRSGAGISRHPGCDAGHWHWRQAGAKHPSVGFVDEPRIADHDHAAIRLAADQAADALLERQRRLGQLVLAEGVAAGRFQVLDARARQRVVRRGERQLFDDHQAQRIALDVHALPEARGAEQHGIARLAKTAQQLLARRLALHQQREIRRARSSARAAAPPRAATRDGW